MLHYAKLVRATLTASLFLTPVAKAAFAGPFEDASASAPGGVAQGGTSIREKDRNAPPPKAAVTTVEPPSRMAVPLKAGNGIFAVPVEVNGTMTIDFAVDSGAGVVVVPAEVFSELQRLGTVKETDILGPQSYVVADGSEKQWVTFMIRSLNVRGIVVENVRGAVTSSTEKSKPLLGQSFLERFKGWSIDNAKHELLLEPYERKEAEDRATQPLEKTVLPLFPPPGTRLGAIGGLPYPPAGTVPLNGDLLPFAPCPFSVGQAY
jgi:clan AA aspartic protease (TIGR02281 family)